MTITPEDRVRDIVAADFRTAAVFHRYGIAFCCAGDRTLGQACRERRLDQAEVLDDVERACAQPDSRVPRFDDWQLETLIAYIVGHHHAYVRTAMPAIAAHTQRVAASHGAEQPELRQVARIFEELVLEMTSHMAKEENILFPYIVAAADPARRVDELPEAPFGRIDNPLRVMEAEHEAAGAAMAEIRRLTHGYHAPENVCATFRVCMQELEAFERNLHEHVHLENNVLFPRARTLAEGAGR
jgi:regulator of cell morphogenesis and NO signaling